MSESSGHVYLVVEDSPVFAAISANTLSAIVGDRGEVIKCSDFEDAEPHLMSGRVKLVVCGYGLGGGRTVHDVRRICWAPIVILTGRVGEMNPPTSSRTVAKDAGPDKLRAAITDLLSFAV